MNLTAPKKEYRRKLSKNAFYAQEALRMFMSYHYKHLDNRTVETSIWAVSDDSFMFDRFGLRVRITIDGDNARVDSDYIESFQIKETIVVIFHMMNLRRTYLLNRS